jgi:hypothetical protein
MFNTSEYVKDINVEDDYINVFIFIGTPSKALKCMLVSQSCHSKYVHLSKIKLLNQFRFHGIQNPI